MLNARRLALVLSALLFVLAPAAPAAAQDGDGAISGTVTDETEPNGVPLENICVTADGAGQGFGATQTDANGNYAIENLNPANYTVRFDDCIDVGPWEAEYYDDAGDDPLNADHVLVGAGQHIEGIDAELGYDNAVIGTIRADDTGAPLRACATVYEAGNALDFVETTVADVNGRYWMDLPPGDYRIEFEGCTFESGQYLTEWYSEASAHIFATTFTVVDAEPTVVDESLKLGGRISGTVTAGDTGAKLNRICVDLWNTAGEYVHSDITFNGDYEMEPLETGDYKVHVDTSSDCIYPSTYPSEWHQDKASFATADVIHVVEGQSYDIDFVLGPGTGGGSGTGGGAGGTGSGTGDSGSDQAACESAEQKLAKAKQKLKKLKQNGASQEKLKKAKDKVKKAKQAVKEAC